MSGVFLVDNGDFLCALTHTNVKRPNSQLTTFQLYDDAKRAIVSVKTILPILDFGLAE
jgi:hypothetical protein